VRCCSFSVHAESVKSAVHVAVFRLDPRLLGTFTGGHLSRRVLFSDLPMIGCSDSILYLTLFFFSLTRSSESTSMLRSGLSDGSLVCICGRSFSQATALSNHERSCQSSKKRLSSALENVRQRWTSSKRRRIHRIRTPEVNEPPPAMPESSLATVDSPGVCFLLQFMMMM
jgi:hypothetical protein